MEPSKYQMAIYDKFCNTNENISINAVAGSGKTTTIVNLLKFVPEDKTALFLAFNNSIVDELKERIGQQRNVTVTTIHSYGWRRIMQRYGSRVKLNQYKSIAKLKRILMKEPYCNEIPATKWGYYYFIISKIVDLMRLNLTAPEEDEVKALADRYDLYVGEREIELALKVYEADRRDRFQFDFTDMIFVPCTDGTVRCNKYDVVFCDESQDFSHAQQELIKKTINRRGRLITVGDSSQAIYGFAGADAQSYEALATLNGDSARMPLSVCYRCSKNIVRLAQNFVPQIEYDETAQEGQVTQDATLQTIKDGDWIICRNLKPLIFTYLWLVKNKIKSKILGKDIGEGLIALIDKTGARSLTAMKVMLSVEMKRLRRDLIKKGIKRLENNPKVERLKEQTEILLALSAEVRDVAGLKRLIDDIFTEERKGILLMTVHKSKGLENSTVYFLCPELIPSKFATQEWQIEQEWNLMYVGITRAKQNLYFVHTRQFQQDLITKIDYGRRTEIKIIAVSY